MANFKKIRISHFMQYIELLTGGIYERTTTH
ncbi:hypothetical protein DET54_101849 [Paenibacillus pabuli]|uniref:Uncharacterized protein n=1 Tax=Paenibacillus pabuli TaxID=1472 RepID=A0A855YF18_9BACL|nr:hypothetical protein DET56_102382 [Paenibacillus pabuli]PXW10178.1 hypothetical protein DEU73_102382 [Paenibacillus taichungensis]RAJ03646.1 hypothetical protein DET54_101849 [Paenibacillus pabuli]